MTTVGHLFAERSISHNEFKKIQLSQCGRINGRDNGHSRGFFDPDTRFYWFKDYFGNFGGVLRLKLHYSLEVTRRLENRFAIYPVNNTKQF